MKLYIKPIVYAIYVMIFTLCIFELYPVFSIYWNLYKLLVALVALALYKLTKWLNKISDTDGMIKIGGK